ncbi:MAG: twin-arginine translocation signal domain-containing protein, partial [Terracidiphilus sp.]
MERRSFLKAVGSAGLAATVTPAWSTDDGSKCQSLAPGSRGTETVPEQASPESILLKDYRPRSLYKIPVTEVPKAKFPIIDMHSHPYAKTSEEIAEWVRNM